MSPKGRNRLYQNKFYKNLEGIMNALFTMVQGMKGSFMVKNESVTIELPNRVPTSELEGLNKFFEKKDELDHKALRLINIGFDNSGNIVIKAKMKGRNGYGYGRLH